MNKPYTLKYSRRNLPHWLVADHSYFVTLRLKGTLPKSLIAEYRQQREQVDQAKALELARKHFSSIERILDSVTDAQWLANSAVAELIINNFDWLRNRGWLIYAAAVMPNHLHILMRNSEGRSGELLKDLAQYKNYTAREANKILNREGALWAREDFDHWIRSREKFEGTVRYIANNPVKAGLVSHWRDWKWTTVDESVRYCLEV